MEDAHTTILNLPQSKTALFAVFDGHGGSKVALYSGRKLQERLVKDDAFQSGNYSVALITSFLGLDTDLRADPAYADETSGCTAVAALISEDWKITVANAGDSRIALSSNGNAIPLSFDHKPTNEIENSRITAAGGFVEYGRVNGNLALSRAIGDFDFKKNTDLPAEQQAVTANPDIIERQLTAEDEFIVLACDGIWDCMSNQEVVDYIRVKIVENVGDLGAVCEQLMEYCLAPDCDLGSVGCDNMTVVIVGLLRGETKEHWLEKITVRVQKAGLTVDENSSQAAKRSGEVATSSVTGEVSIVASKVIEMF